MPTLSRCALYAASPLPSLRWADVFDALCPRNESVFDLLAHVLSIRVYRHDCEYSIILLKAIDVAPRFLRVARCVLALFAARG